MKKVLAATVFALAICSLMVSGFAKEDEKGKSGEELFKKHCIKCHPDGSNIISPEKALSRTAREKNKVVTVEDIVKLMRNPGPGMIKFDEKTISEKDGKAIAEYILKTFNK